jgi:hypothetical protein
LTLLAKFPALDNPHSQIQALSRIQHAGQEPGGRLEAWPHKNVSKPFTKETRSIFMRRVLLYLCLAAPLATAANLAGTWTYTPPPNPNAKGNRQPRESLYIFKVNGARFTGEPASPEPPYKPAASPISATARSTAEKLRSIFTAGMGARFRITAI